MSSESEKKSIRQRKSIEIYNASSEKVDKEFAVGKGNGIMLGEYPFFCEHLQKIRGDSDLVCEFHLLLNNSQVVIIL
jgi:hypothetical protein